MVLSFLILTPWSVDASISAFLNSNGARTMDEASTVIQALLRTLAKWQGHDVLVHEVWSDSPASACVVFEHTAGDLGPLGYRVSFPPHAIANDPTSTGESWALGLIEPLGALTKGIRRDIFGIGWVAGIDRDNSLPVPPTWRPNEDLDRE